MSDDCYRWDTNTGQCTSCYLGFLLSNGQCYTNNLIPISTVDSNCALWHGNKCLKCSERSYFGPIGICIPVSNYCKTWNDYDGACLSCFKGYNLVNKACILPPHDNQMYIEKGCRKWNHNTESCI